MTGNKINFSYWHYLHTQTRRFGSTKKNRIKFSYWVRLRKPHLFLHLYKANSYTGYWDLCVYWRVLVQQGRPINWKTDSCEGDPQISRAVLHHKAWKCPIKECRKRVEPIRHFHILFLQDAILILSFHLRTFVRWRFYNEALELKFRVHISSSDTFHISQTWHTNKPTKCLGDEARQWIWW
jgi:hypothetical protein